MKKSIKKMVIWIAGLVLLFLVSSSLIGWFISAPVYSGSKSDHFDGKKFINPGGVKAKGPMDVLKWMLSRERGEWKEVENAYVGPPPVKKLDTEKVRITFINHSTALIQMNGLNILTDPIWSERCSPVQWVGPKRVRPAGINFEDLPSIDLVLLSHNHYDHLDKNTIKKLEKAHHPLFVVPLGVAQFLRKLDVSQVYELDWDQSLQVLNNITVTGVPAIHFSGRGSVDRDATLWCGFIIKGNTTKIYYAGDTGYGEIFKEIGRKHGPFNASLIPIGAYKPKWFMSPIHVSPSDAVKIHQDVKSEKSIAIHYGTFPLADEGYGDAPSDLEKARKEAGLSNDSFVILEEGHFLDIN